MDTLALVMIAVAIFYVYIFLLFVVAGITLVCEWIERILYGHDGLN